MRRRLFIAASVVALAGGYGIGVSSPALAQHGEGPVQLCQFADSMQAREWDCVVGDVGADGVTVINPTGPVYGDVPRSLHW
ncbi:MAG: hypothetical protein M3179_09035 [Actinomycetota bacterium]|nr:hypothetical protein [Actinomycetota bacterium]